MEVGEVPPGDSSKPFVQQQGKVKKAQGLAKDHHVAPVKPKTADAEDKKIQHVAQPCLAHGFSFASPKSAL